MIGRSDSPLDELRAAIDSRRSALSRIRLNRLNVSAWICADSQWMNSLEKTGLLDVADSASLVGDYLRDRDRVLFSRTRFSSQAIWSRHYPFASRRLAATEALWQAAGFVTSRRFRATSQHRYSKSQEGE
jgi:hypothetical protein